MNTQHAHHRPSILLALLVAVLVALVGLGQAQTLVAADANFERSPDPGNTFSLTDLYVNRHIYDPLVENLPGGESGPMLAESWEVSEDGLEWTFDLREGVTFHNGEAFDAEDVKFSFDRILENDLTQAFLFPSLAEVTVVDDHTVRFRTSEPQGSFLSNVAMVSILPSEAVQEMGDDFWQERYGTGPFQFVEHEASDRWVFEANPDYWREGTPQVDELILRSIFEEATAQAALQAGEIDILTAVSPDIALVLENDPNVEVLFEPGIETTYLQANLTREPFDDPRVVEALNYAVDREAITQGLWMGEAIPTSAYVPPGLLGHHEGLEPFPYDPERSRELLAEAGHPDGVTIEMLGPTGVWPQSRQVMEAIQQQAAEAGFDIELNVLEAAAYVENRNAGNYDLLYISSIAVTQEGMRFLQERLLEDVHQSGFDDPEFNLLMNELLQTIDPEEQQALFEDIQELLYGAPPHVYLYHPPSIYAISTDVTGFEARPDRSLYLWNVSKEE